MLHKIIEHLYGFRLPLEGGTYREGLILQIGDGYGEIAPLPGWSPETFQEAKEEAVRLLPSFPDAAPTLPSVQWGFQCAKLPFPKRIKIPLNALEKHQEGCRALKLKLGSLDVKEAIAKVKNAPPNVKLRLDFNKQWSLAQLLAFVESFPPDQFDYFEEPCNNFPDLLLFSKQTGFPIAVDESIPLVPFWEIPTLKALVIKPTILGTIPTPPPGVELIFSSAYESGVGTLHLARLAMQHNPSRPHGLNPYFLLTKDLLSSRPTLSNGFFSWEYPTERIVRDKKTEVIT